MIVERVTLCETEEVRAVEEPDTIDSFLVFFRVPPMTLMTVIIGSRGIIGR